MFVLMSLSRRLPFVLPLIGGWRVNSSVSTRIKRCRRLTHKQIWLLMEMLPRPAAKFVRSSYTCDTGLPVHSVLFLARTSPPNGTLSTTSRAAYAYNGQHLLHLLYSVSELQLSAATPLWLYHRAASLPSWIEFNCLRSAAVSKAARLSIYWLDAACRLVIPLRQVALAQLYKYHHQCSNAAS